MNFYEKLCLIVETLVRVKRAGKSLKLEGRSLRHRVEFMIIFNPLTGLNIEHIRRGTGPRDGQSMSRYTSVVGCNNPVTLRTLRYITSFQPPSVLSA